MNQVLLTFDGKEFSVANALLEMSYLIAATCFVWGLKLLSKPETARKGNFWAAAGMVLAMITTLFLHEEITL